MSCCQQSLVLQYLDGRLDEDDGITGVGCVTTWIKVRGGRRKEKVGEALLMVGTRVEPAVGRSGLGGMLLCQASLRVWDFGTLTAETARDQERYRLTTYLCENTIAITVHQPS